MTAQRRVTAHIMNSLTAGEFGLGQKIPTERALAEVLGVSRTAVRDAIKTLCGLGVLEQRHGSGTFVAAATSQFSIDPPRQIAAGLLESDNALSDLFDARVLLECQLAAWASHRMRESDKAKLTQFLAELEAHRHGDDLLIAFGHDDKFHRMVAAAAGNTIIERVMDSIWSVLSVVRTETLSIEGRAKRSYDDHIRILTAVLAGNEESAKAEMFLHLQGVREDLDQRVDEAASSSY